MRRLLIAVLLAMPLGGCYVEPAPVRVYAPPPVVVDPFPYVWIGPGWYGGRYYYSHPGHPGHRR